MSPRILTKKHLLDHNSTSRRNGFCIAVSFKATKKRKSMGMSWFLFQPKEQLIKMEVGWYFDGKTSIYSNLIVAQKVFGFRVSYHGGGRVSTLANCYPNIKNKHQTLTPASARGICLMSESTSFFPCLFHPFCFTPIKKVTGFVSEPPVRYQELCVPCTIVRSC